MNSAIQRTACRSISVAAGESDHAPQFGLTDDASKSKVKIYGAACDTVKSDDKARVDVLLQCRVK